MSRDYRDYVPQLAPPWLLERNGAQWQNATGDVLDALVARVKAAVKQRMPGLASWDSVAELGDERGLERAAGETLVAYRARLKVAWDTWAYAGTAYGMLQAFLVAGYSDVALEQPRGSGAAGTQYTLDGGGNLVITALPAGSWAIDEPPGYPAWSPATTYAVADPATGLPVYVRPTSASGNHHRYRCSVAGVSSGVEPVWPLGAGGTVVDGGVTWTEAGDDVFWSAFEVIFTPPLPASWIAGGVPASSSDEANLIRRIISTWKPANTTCRRIIIITAGELWGYPPSGHWGDPGNWGGNTSVVWTP